MKMKTLLFPVVAAFVVMINSACHPKSASVAPPPVIYGVTSEDNRAAPVARIIPKVEIVIYIDDSWSMDPHQTNLSINADKFVAGIAESKIIDFRIAVVQAWDSYRYGRIPAKCMIDGKEHRNYEGLGVLLPLKAPAGKEQLLKNFAGNANGRFVSRAEGFKEVLAETLKLGAQKLRKDGPCETGPEVEELFPPMIASIDANTRQNQGFWRDDSFKVFIILSDAFEGQKKLSASDVNQNLRNWLGAPLVGYQDKFRVYSVAMKPGERVSAQCKADYGWQLPVGSVVPDHPFAELTRLANNSKTNDAVLSICSSNYGSQLLKFGQEIKRDTLRNQKFAIDGEPNFNRTDLPENKQFQVLLDGKPLKLGNLKYDSATGVQSIADGSWAYLQYQGDDRKMNRIIYIRGDLKALEENPTAQVEVRYSNVTDRPGQRINIVKIN